ncbi:MAG: nucleotidyltransferase domain-containing protein [Bacteroidetes bacterium]|nr:nucleotidyltransferase domain-containing protein [Bacteroidota bacterium]
MKNKDIRWIQRFLNYKKGLSQIKSAVDLVIHGKVLSLLFLNKLLLEIDDLLLPYTFDISIFADIDNQDLIDHIKRVGMIFYEKPFQDSTAAKTD